jgi:putative flippase GtrA
MLGLDVISYSISMSFLFFCFIVFNKKKKKKLGEKMQNFILMAFQILYALLLDISVYCALIEHAYI